MVAPGLRSAGWAISSIYTWKMGFEFFPPCTISSRSEMNEARVLAPGAITSFWSSTKSFSIDLGGFFICKQQPVKERKDLNYNKNEK